MTTAYRILTPQKRSIKPEQNRQYLNFIRSQSCCVCNSWRGVESAHFGPRGASQKADDRQTLPLCRKHHQQAKNSYHALGPAPFAIHHNLDIEQLILEYNELYYRQSKRPNTKPITRVRLKPADLMEDIGNG